MDPSVTEQIPATGFYFRPSDHTYWLDGRCIPAYSHIVQDVGVGLDLKSIPKANLERARERGEKIHLAAEYYDRDMLDWSTVDPAFVPYLSAWISFLENEHFIVDMDMIEEPTYHKQFQYGCTADRRGEFHLDAGPVPGVVEIKNTYSSAAYWRMQTASQEQAMRSHGWCEGLDQNEVIRCAVNLKKDGNYEMMWHNNPYKDKDGSKDFRDFMCCLRVYSMRRAK